MVAITVSPLEKNVDGKKLAKPVSVNGERGTLPVVMPSAGAMLEEMPPELRAAFSLREP